MIIFTNKDALRPEYDKKDGMDYIHGFLHQNNYDIYLCSLVARGKPFNIKYACRRKVKFKGIGIFKHTVPADYITDISFVEKWKELYDISVTENFIREELDQYCDYAYNASCLEQVYDVIIKVPELVSQEIYNKSVIEPRELGKKFYKNNIDRIDKALERINSGDIHRMCYLKSVNRYFAFVTVHTDRLEISKKEPIRFSEYNINQLSEYKMICGFALGIEQYFSYNIIKSLSEYYCTYIFSDGKNICVFLSDKIKNIDLLHKEKPITAISWN